ncbi:FecR domain-containing protein [Pendulispora albinea]|uniref:FecR domain-containing protein n=1 Tax=Pendulispora albinea TaxID=2741071 RepID=UPI00374E0A45
MSMLPKYASLAAKALRAGEAPRDPPNDAEARTQRIDAIRDAIRQRARKKTQKRVAIASTLAAAAAAIALVVRAQHTPIDAMAEGAQGPVQIERDGAREALASGTPIRSGDHVVAGEGSHVELALATGTRIALESRGDLSVVSQDRNQIYWLAAGSMKAHVAKLKQGTRFIVRTPDTEVEVRGTQFHVTTVKPDLACANGSTTRVRVDEGTVTVRHAGTENQITAGQEWPRTCYPAALSDSSPAPATNPAPPKSPAPDPDRTAPSTNPASSKLASPSPAPALAPAPNPDRTTAPHPRTSSRPTPAPAPSELAAQNDLFARAADQKRTGDLQGAIATFETFLSRYPQSALSESATVERWRLLARVDRALGRAAAKDYLNHYPNGFARRDARALIERGD